MKIPQSVRDEIAKAPLAHLTTLNKGDFVAVDTRACVCLNRLHAEPSIIRQDVRD